MSEEKPTNSELAQQIVGAVEAVQDAHETLVEGAKKLAAHIADTGVHAAVVKLHDGPLDLDDEEEVAAVAETMPVAGLVSFDCPFEPESVYLGGVPNSREIVTVSGDWEAPVSGYYSILAIDGGDGAYVYINNKSCEGGASGAYKQAVTFFEKGQIVPITIGSGGTGFVGNGAPDSRKGGKTSIGDVDFSAYENCRLSAVISYRTAYNYGYSPGGGFGGYAPLQTEVWYGAGGAGYAKLAGDESASIAQDGQPGAVILTWYDPAKDPRATIDTASSVSVDDLAKEIAALKAQVEELKNG